jgi:flagellar biosynthesis protein FlhF
MMEQLMQYFTVQAPTPREALEKMKRQYGDDARILTQKSLRLGGVFGLFARQGIEITGYIAQSVGKKRQMEVEEEKKRILDNAKREQTFQQLLREIHSLKDVIAGSGERERGGPPAVQRVVDLLRQNDFSEDYIQTILKRIRAEFSLQRLEDPALIQSAVVEWIGESIQVLPCPIPQNGERKIFILIGPTGVGKTTTIAKLAAIYGLGNSRSRPRKVRIVTIDNYRIAAKDQIATYAEIMRLPISFVESYDDFKKILALNEDAELLLVDTIGKSPRDLAKLAEMKEILDAAGSAAEIHLAISATTKTSDVEEILKQFEPFGYRSIVLTKLDETTRIGNIISVLAQKDKPISYISDGQKVPQDLEPASVLRLLAALEGLRIQQEKLEKKFGKLEEIIDKNWS